MERIVVGVDGSEPAKAALRWAVDEARRRQTKLEVVHAWNFPAAEAVLEAAKSTRPGRVPEPPARLGQQPGRAPRALSHRGRPGHLAAAVVRAGPHASKGRNRVRTSVS